MTVPPNLANHRLIWFTVQLNPGSGAKKIARLTGLHYGTVLSTLPGMENSGWLLSQDEHGKLWPFKHPKMEPYLV